MNTDSLIYDLITADLPNAQLCIIPGGTHFAPVRQSDLFNKTVNKFLNEPFTRPDSKF
jgi:pimeloyl-ACP methyl ester carboxylesterase